MQHSNICALQYTMGLLVGIASQLKDKALGSELIGAADTIQMVLEREQTEQLQLMQQIQQTEMIPPGEAM